MEMMTKSLRLYWRGHQAILNYGDMPEMYGAQRRGPGAADNDMMSELNSLAMSMPDEQSRQAIQNIMSKYR
jgi:hypothetical protein